MRHHIENILFAIIFIIMPVGSALAFKPIPSKLEARIEIKEFIVGQHISGVVSGLSHTECDSCKIVIYVKTDKWYIHPYIEGGEGLSFATLSPSCTWKIKTIVRSPSPKEIAFLIVKKNYEVPHQLFNIEDLEYISIYINEWSEVTRPAYAKPILGEKGSSSRWGSGWIDLWRSTDFKQGDNLKLRIGGTADKIIIRFLSKGVDPSAPTGIINGIFKVPQDRVVQIDLDKNYNDVIQISVHGSQNPWGRFPLGGSNGPATLESVERIDHSTKRNIRE